MKSEVKFATDYVVEDLVMALNNLVNNRNAKVARQFLCHSPASLLYRLADALEIDYSKSDPLVDLMMKIMDSKDEEA